MRNPFRIRASQRFVSDDDFVRLFGAGALELLQSVGDPWGGLVFLRSAPGGGKTTFLRLLTPRPLQLTDQLGDTNQHVKATREGLREAGAIGAAGPDVLGTMVVFTPEYRELAAFDKGNVLFRELLNSRIVVAALRAVLERLERVFPDDLARVSFGWDPDSDATIPAKANGVDLFDWASKIERGFYDRLDALGELPPVTGGHARLDGLRWFAQCKITGPYGAMEVKRVLLMDELQALTSSQRNGLIDTVTNARERCGVWIAERLEALTHRDLLSEGALEDRDYENVIQLERRWSGTKAKTFARFTEAVANLRAGRADGFENRELFPLIAEADDLSELEGTLEARIKDMDAAVVRLGGVRYAAWLRQAREASGSVLERALRWRTLLILATRDAQKAQGSFEFDELPDEELAKRGGSGTDRAAEHFLRTETRAPVYFGRETLGILATSNVDQYLEVVGTLFEEVSAKGRFRRDQPTPLSAVRQDDLIRQVARERWDGLTRRIPRGVEARRLLDAVGESCRFQTFRASAPYAPGVTGFAITMDDRRTLIEGRDEDIKHLLPLRDVLTSLVAHNLLVPKLDHQQGKRSHVVFYLNRLLCVHFGLPLGYGGWRARTLRELVRWQDLGVKADDLSEGRSLV